MKFIKMKFIKILYCGILLSICSFTTITQKEQYPFIKIKEYSLISNNIHETFTCVKGYNYHIDSNNENIIISIYVQRNNKLEFIKKGRIIDFNPKETTIYHFCFDNIKWDESTNCKINLYIHHK